MGPETSSPPSQPPTGLARSLADAGWFQVLDDILGGFGHDLNGRVASFEGLIMLVELDEPGEETPVLPYLQTETGRLSEIVRTFRGLQGDIDGDPEAMWPPDAVAHVGGLHRRHRGLDRVTTESQVAEGLPPIRVNPSRLARTLLIVLSRAGRAAVEADVTTVTLGVREEMERVLFEVAWADAPADQGWDPGALEPLNHIAQADGGVVESTADGGVRVSFPAMTRPGG